MIISKTQGKEHTDAPEYKPTARHAAQLCIQGEDGSLEALYFSKETPYTWHGA